jgi:hypothetical protein
MKGLRSHYEDVRSSGAFLNLGRDYYEDDKPVERTSEGGDLEGLVDKISESFVGEAPDSHLIGLAAGMADAPPQSLTLAVDGIRQTEGPLVREALQNLLELFFEERRAARGDVRTRGFLTFAFNVYTRSNTKDGRVERIKAVLDELLRKHSEAYLQTSREASKGALRKAIYVYLALFAQSRS